MWLNHFVKTNLYKSLNEEQKKAINLDPDKHGLVIAGAGTGKTKTLITRICALVQTKTFLPNEIVALTFTNKAAKEMQERLEMNIKEQASLVNIGTFHSFALKLIKEDLEGFGYKNKIKLLDEKEQILFVKSLFNENRWEEKNNAIQKLVDYINNQKENGIRSVDVKSKGKGVKNLNQQYQIYEQSTKEKSIVDFSELVLLLNERLKSDLEYKKNIQSKYKNFLIDEFQDTNPIQYQTLLLLTEDNGSIFAVGDDCQSIYSFRGAEIKNIFDFKNNLVKENYVILEQNYRSTKNIVEMSNQFILKAKEKIDKNLKTLNEDGKLIYIFKAFNEYKEAEFVRNSIENIIKRDKVKYSDFAVIYRGNAQSAKIESALTQGRIPFKVSGGMSYFDCAEIKTLMACAKLLINPNDHHSFIRVVDKLKIIKIDKKTLDGWNIEAELEKLSFSELITERKSFKYEELGKLYKYIKKGQEEFKYSSLRESFEDFLNNIGLFESIVNEDQNKKNKKNTKLTNKTEQKLENIHFFLKEIEKYEEEGGSSFYHFITQIDQTLNLIKENTLNANNLLNNKDNLGCVNLMTIHASKGLEFKYVFLIGVEEGVIPSTHAIEENNIEEERRLMYVGMTRAKKELYLTFCQTRFNGYEQVSYLPSRFFLDLNVNYLQPLNTEWLPEPKPFSPSDDKIEEVEKNIKSIQGITISIEKRNENLEFLNSFEQEIMKKQYQFLDLLNDKVNTDNIEVEKINEEDLIISINEKYKTKDGIGILKKIEKNEFEEDILYIEINDKIKKYMPDYELIIKI